MLDDQAEILIDDRTFPAVGFPIGNTFVFHPGDAAGALAAIGKAVRVRLRSDGAGIDSGAVTIDLPAEALNWLKQCGTTFDIAIDKPTDPDAPELPVPLPRSPRTAFLPATPAGPPGMADKQKIEGWDASELRNNDGNIIVCYIRRRYVTGSEPGSRRLGTFLMVSQRKGFTVMLKDPTSNCPKARRSRRRSKFGSNALHRLLRAGFGRGRDRHLPAARQGACRRTGEGGPRHLQDARSATISSFRYRASVVPWLRACARRNGIAMEPVAQ